MESGINFTCTLQAQFSQMRPVAMAPSVGPRMPMFPPGVPGVGQQLFYGQPPPAFINPQVLHSLLLLCVCSLVCWIIDILC